MYKYRNRLIVVRFSRIYSHTYWLVYIVSVFNVFDI
nr:MAG TPA: hypothetical protein [Caudoviricetes sp.]